MFFLEKICENLKKGVQCAKSVENVFLRCAVKNTPLKKSLKNKAFMPLLTVRGRGWSATAKDQPRCAIGVQLVCRCAKSVEKYAIWVG